ncbi:glucokinase [Rhodobacter sphaeroides]|jgi:glucokinase (EC 2.7.1.2)|uniref:Glucokinase n=1 Tax=Cereibacter sphaeroides (strain ATCC 17023 / DSM 158 / JCM 6121 / CCUG 31486 / LMG 2827 / NBRC 12203 / NCIMB 8253 / ATH 2.4.1.) TaxID=272943 RepID=Q3J2E8_CERS4|nr:glucokinase [Cereibacter sphaeroides]ABA79036.1 putative glucokinase [Cereibacter sphaeroides 2.4.1]AMJ47356.1 glucokinase [Cereibacter sphaeroides]ANS34069.1 glucokinase [Cereibacter sphaeroides]ATN63113.1 glucokinase [Cereibacter sphaeroides]AXC61243.1 glucokinase [Cereibacter sphaeroides 2.4.1]
MADAPLCLVADIGGTNTRVALAEGSRLRPETTRRFRNADYPALAPVLRDFLSVAGSPEIDGTCVAAAGPVRDGVALLTNLAWTVDGAELQRATGAPRVAVLNDLQAQGHALGHLDPANLRVLIPGPTPRRGGPMLVVGVGTGFNAAPVHDVAGLRLVAASECGHAGMPVRTARDLRLAEFVQTAHGFAGVEDVLSGRGLERLYAFTAAEAGLEDRKSAAEIMAAIAEPGPARAAAELFARLLGAEAGNLALIHLPFGGLYLCGGVARAFAAHLGPMGFAENFRDKGRFSAFMDDFPVCIVEDDYAALTGCAAYLATL